MEREIQNLCALEHVGAAFVCNNAGEVVVASEPVLLSTATMGGAGRAVAQTFSVMTSANRPVDRLEMVYDSWRLFARDLGSGVLLAVCHAAADMGVVRMTADVIVTGWRRDGIVARRLGETSTGRIQLLTRAHLDERAWESWRVLTAS